MKKLLTSLPYLIILVGFVLTMGVVRAGRNASQQSNAQTRAITCVLFINAVTRTQADIERCITHIEQETHQKIYRDDKAVKGV